MHSTIEACPRRGMLLAMALFGWTCCWGSPTLVVAASEEPRYSTPRETLPANRDQDNEPPLDEEAAPQEVSPATPDAADPKTAEPKTATAESTPAPRLFEGALPFEIGEKLEYKAQLRVAGAMVDAGTSVFTVLESGPGKLLFNSTARGSKLGYTLKATVTSEVYRGATQPIRYAMEQRGSEKRDKKLQFYPGGVVYLKVKHCHTVGCTRADHHVKVVDWVGPIPWGRKKVHCTDSYCGHSKHRVWRERGRHEIANPGLDLLTAVYYARTLAFGKIGTSHVIPIVNDRDRWLVEIEVVERSKITVGAGEYDAVQIALKPKPVVGELRQEFEGLFGMKGTIEIWMDVKTGRPLRISGQVPFAFFTFDCSVELTHVGRVEPDSKGD